MQAILLAAGFGTRLRPYTNLRPKPLFPVLNQPLLYRLLERLDNSGCDRIIVNAHHLAGQIEAALIGRHKVRLQYEPEILGTGGSLRQALPNLGSSPVLVANGDVYHDISLKALYEHHTRSGNAVTLAMHDQPRFNNVHTAGDRVLGFRGSNNHDACHNCLAFTGLQVVNPEVIAQIPDGRFFHSIDLYQQLAPTGCIGLMRVDGSFWQDMGTPTDYLTLHQALLPHADHWLIDASARVAKGTHLNGWGCIGPGAVVATDAELEDCVVWDGACIQAGARHRFRILTGNMAIDDQPDEAGELMS